MGKRYEPPVSSWPRGDLVEYGPGPKRIVRGRRLGAYTALDVFELCAVGSSEPGEWFTRFELEKEELRHMASKGHRPPPTHTIRCTAPGCGQQVNVSRTEPPEIPRVEMHRHRGAMCGAVGQPICPGGCGITEAERHPRRANEWRCVNCKLSWSDDPVNAAAAESVKHYSPPPGSGAAHNLPDEPLAVIEVDVRPNRAPYGYGQYLIFEGALWLLGVNCKLKEKPGDHLDEFELLPAGLNGSRVSLKVARKLLDLGARSATAGELHAGVPLSVGERTARAATLRAEGTALLAKADRLEAAAKMIEQAEEMIKNDD